MQREIDQLKNSKLIPQDANNFKAGLIASQLINYTCERGLDFYRALSILSNKTILQVRHLERKDFDSFFKLISNLDTKLKEYQYLNTPIKTKLI
jgi:hypothetical protein